MVESEQMDKGLVRPKQRMADGTMRLSISVSKVGPLPYTLPDGSVQMRHVVPFELYSQESIDSLVMQSITKSHPDFLFLDDLEARKEREVGKTGQIVEGVYPYLVVSAVVGDKDTLAMIDESERRGRPLEVSMGYRQKLVSQPEYLQSRIGQGLPTTWECPDGTTWDLRSVPEDHMIQTKRIYDHLSILPPNEKGRAGSDVALLTYSQDNLKEEISMTTPEMTKMKGISVSVDSAEEMQALLEKLVRMEALEAECDDLKKANMDLRAAHEATLASHIAGKKELDAVGAMCEDAMTAIGLPSEDKDGSACDSFALFVDATKAAIHSRDEKLAGYAEAERQASMDALTEVLKRQLAVSGLHLELATEALDAISTEVRTERSIKEAIIKAAGGETKVSAMDSEVGAVYDFVASQLVLKEAKIEQEKSEAAKADSMDSENHIFSLYRAVNEASASGQVSASTDLIKEAASRFDV